MMTMPKRDEHSLTAGIPLFCGVHSSLLQEVSLAMVHHYNDGDTLLTRGAEAKNLTILLEGEVRIFVEDTFLVSRRAPAVLGEQAFIDSAEHSATVRAQGFVKAVVIPKAVVEKLLKDNAFTTNLLRVVSCKLR